MPLTAEQLSCALFDADPMDTCCKENDCFDEYDAIAEDILSKREQGQSLEKSLRHTFGEWFGEVLAKRIDVPALCRRLAN
ncbi:hypothetical protein FGL86_00965 [Pistricoccus aurantiacus]|uniref:Uncharacterized protein n=1 Tax=Pistricoccus aurantiacus TaxID=1883414 RepID=A0A5B8SM24_9GAMM|nr:hypothetical protein [Pistricoccus aurantiacus]QEA37776.1 hypothetical protein FGL86_00965 [Pistricoccus aurantiacus]